MMKINSANQKKCIMLFMTMNFNKNIIMKVKMKKSKLKKTINSLIMQMMISLDNKIINLMMKKTNKIIKISKMMIFSDNQCLNKNNNNKNKIIVLFKQKY